MSELFDQLLIEIQKLLEVGQSAFSSPLSELGEREQTAGGLEAWQNSWKRYLEAIENHYRQLQQAISTTDQYNQNSLINQQLAYFRQLPRMLAEGGDPEWSAYYQDIRQHMKKIHCLLIDIDTKYHLGQHADD